MEKTASETTEAKGTTDKDRAIMHGFDVKISFRDIDCSSNDTGIVLERKLLNDNSCDLIIDEYLENDHLIEAFNSIFESEGYVVKELYPDISRGGSGWSGHGSKFGWPGRCGGPSVRRAAGPAPG